MASQVVNLGAEASSPGADVSASGGTPLQLLDVNVSHAYAGLEVLHDVKFQIRPNEFVCIVGPSGCGKSTLSRIMVGIQEPSTGRVLLRGQPVNPARDRIAMVFQEAALWPWRTVMQNVRVGMEIKGLSVERQLARGQEMLRLVGLSGFEQRYPYQLSGGMKQRVSIARAFALEADLVVMDEPFVSLDAPTREEMQLELLRLWEHEKRTVLFVTHNLEEAILLGDRIMVFGPRPATVRREVQVDLPRPRDVTDPRVVALRRELRASMKVTS